ncbi:MAG: hypothetical protein K940chlam2_00355 [Chlamydiae bacterium]|nr:hypothetical protein [Chlamydiota bacterium]
MLEKKTRLGIFILMLSMAPLMSGAVVPTQILIKSLNVEPAEDELVTIEKLLRATKKQLEVQEQLKILINRFNEEKELFVKGAKSKLHARYMISTAAHIDHKIRQHGMEPLFASDFLEELALFTAIGKKERVDVRNQIR